MGPPPCLKLKSQIITNRSTAPGTAILLQAAGVNGIELVEIGETDTTGSTR